MLILGGLLSLLGIRDSRASIWLAHVEIVSRCQVEIVVRAFLFGVVLGLMVSREEELVVGRISLKV